MNISSRLSAFFALCALLFLSACATTGLPTDGSKIDFSKGSVVVMRVSMSNEYKPDYITQNMFVSFKDLKQSNTPNPWLKGKPDQIGNSLLADQLLPSDYLLSDFNGIA